MKGVFMSFKENILDLNVTVHQTNGGIMPDMHYHTAHEIYISESERTFLITDQLVHLRERDVLLIKPNVVHCGINAALSYSLIELPDVYFNKFFTDYGRDLVTACFEKNVIRVRESDFKTLISCAEKLQENNDDILSLTQLFLILKNNRSRATHAESTDSLASNIVDYVTENYKSIESLDVIANAFYISKGYLCRLFKEHTGTSINKYINLLKINTSLEIISHKNLSMEEISRQSGFNSPANFSKTFKTVIGIPPLKYQKDNEKK